MKSTYDRLINNLLRGQMEAGKLTKVLIALMVICCMIKAQNISPTSCFTSAGLYECNNQGYQGFEVNNSATSNLSTVGCAGGINTCWYQGNSSSSSITTYIFCNFTFSGCSTCNNNMSCGTCYGGYYSYNFNVLYSYSNCQTCSAAIPGCQTCSGQTQCNQCALQYLNIGGQCYTQSGELVSGFDPFSSGGSTAAEIVMDVFIFLILLAIGYAFFYLFVCKKTFSNSNTSTPQQQAKYEPSPSAQRQSEMQEPHEMRRDSLNKKAVHEPVSTRNPYQQPVDASLRDQLIVDNTERSITHN